MALSRGAVSASSLLTGSALSVSSTSSAAYFAFVASRPAFSAPTTSGPRRRGFVTAFSSLLHR